MPSALGLAPVVAHIAWKSMGTTPAAGPHDGSRPVRPVALAWMALAVFLAVRPAWLARHPTPQGRPGSELESLVPPGTTVVVESILSLLPLMHYQKRADVHYVYPMDWDAVLRPPSYLGAPLEYHALRAWEHVGYISPATLTGTSVPCTEDQFVVLHSYRQGWYVDHIAKDPAFEINQMGQVWTTIDGGPLFLVRRRKGLVPLICRDSARAPSEEPPD